MPLLHFYVLLKYHSGSILLTLMLARSILPFILPNYVSIKQVLCIITRTGITSPPWYLEKRPIWNHWTSLKQLWRYGFSELQTCLPIHVMKHLSSPTYANPKIYSAGSQVRFLPSVSYFALWATLLCTIQSLVDKMRRFISRRANIAKF